MAGQVIDLVGKYFGRLRVLERAATINRRTRWKCLCSCGSVVDKTWNNLHKSVTASCGCARSESNSRRMTTHGMCGTLVHATWNSMMHRCYVVSHSRYHYYGGAGVKVCERWKTFLSFFEDMGHRPSPHATLDRIDNARGYEPGNCRWATRQEQTVNRRCVPVVTTLEGERISITEMARRLAMPEKTLRNRFRIAGLLQPRWGPRP